MTEEPGMRGRDAHGTWERVDAAIGLPVTFFADAARGGVVSQTPRALSARTGADLDSAQQTVVSVLTEEAHLSAEGVSGSADRAVAVHLSRGDEWLEPLTAVDWSAALPDRLTEALRDDARLRVEGAVHRLDAAVLRVGSDALRWALLRSASKVSPFVVTPGLEVLERRTDDQPLAQVRRAHAALVLRERAERAAAPSAPEASAAHELRVAVFLASRAAHDARRTGRSRPAASAVEDVAREALTHLERTPVTRTDASAGAAARRVLADALAAAGIAAPVPY